MHNKNAYVGTFFKNAITCNNDNNDNRGIPEPPKIDQKIDLRLTFFRNCRPSKFEVFSRIVASRDEMPTSRREGWECYDHCHSLSLELFNLKNNLIWVEEYLLMQISDVCSGKWETKRLAHLSSSILTMLPTRSTICFGLSQGAHGSCEVNKFILYRLSWEIGLNS